MTVFRGCIDLHSGQVKQIVGGTLDTSSLKTNFVSNLPPSHFAQLYKDNNVLGTHVICLGPGNEEAATEALATWPGKLQVGGGITHENAGKWIERGADKVIVTSYLFPDAKFSWERLEAIKKAAGGKENLVIDLSCRRKGDKWFVAMDRWQRITDMEVNEETISQLEEHCAEFLIHAADVEGLCKGIDEDLVTALGKWCSIPTTYAGGAKSVDDLKLVDELSMGKVDLTYGSALDIFGGDLVKFEDVVAWNKTKGQ
ncbi:1--5-imidazole-4-carboxamide isomerase [Ascobolus immersus RN42]|uniref:1-(5-phosphoribosyl)-5-[(5-phosphoribosylamino)methylideneamino] imidazole-4-carboxamide isomerase n=1 Tax=Ascobolus immersus RN42 TaxID=1160509 RepID=A0A3N4HYS2_ASCIM|nr:1--5-imidazole-4-carboxamide isomerase [Ascobolus immersus RN42]